MEQERFERAAERFVVPVEVTIRLCTEADLRSLEWFGIYWHHRSIIEESYRRHESGDNLMIVAEVRGELVGQVWVDLTKKADRGIGVLWALRVFPMFQGFGIGTRLVLAAESELLARGFRIAELGVEKHNVDARRLYGRLGYRVAGEEHDHFSFRTPNGKIRRERIVEWVLHKRLTVRRPSRR